MSPIDLENRFRYHAPDDSKRRRHEFVRGRFRDLAEIVNGSIPESDEKECSIRALEEALMWANAAIARHPID